MTKFGDLQEHQPEPFNRDAEWPEWVDNLLMILMGISHPGSKFKNLKKWKAKDLGRFLGRQYAGEHLCVGEVPLSSQVIQEGIKCGEWAESWERQRRPDLDLAVGRGHRPGLHPACARRFDSVPQGHLTISYPVVRRSNFTGTRDKSGPERFWTACQ
jgi:hypothetical protein